MTLDPKTFARFAARKAKEDEFKATCEASMALALAPKPPETPPDDADGSQRRALRGGGAVVTEQKIENPFDDTGLQGQIDELKGIIGSIAQARASVEPVDLKVIPDELAAFAEPHESAAEARTRLLETLQGLLARFGDSTKTLEASFGPMTDEDKKLMHDLTVANARSNNWLGI